MTAQQIRTRQAEIEAAGGVPAAVVMAPGSKALSGPETKTLLDCEAVIERGLKTFEEVGAALVTIRDQRLYRFKFATFEQYCRERWNWTARRAQQVCDATSVVAQLRESLPDGPLPQNERQARALAAVPEERRAEVWKGVVDDAPKDEEGKPQVTAKAIEARNPRSRGTEGNPKVLADGHLEARADVREQTEALHPDGSTENLDLWGSVVNAEVELAAALRQVRKFQHRMGPTDRVRMKMQVVFELAKSVYALWMKRTSEWDLARSLQSATEKKRFVLTRKGVHGPTFYLTAAGGWSMEKGRAEVFASREEAAKRLGKRRARIVTLR